MAGAVEENSGSRGGWLSEFFQGLIDLIYPPSCALCGRISSDDICVKCLSRLIPLGHQVCGKCGNPSSPDEPCPYCLAIEFNFDKAMSIFLYEEPLRDAILDFKYHREVRKGEVLRSLLADWFVSSPLMAEGYDLIIPIPITPRKRKRRSYNQSEVLAAGIEAASGIPCAPFVLVKRNETPSQTGFDFSGRAKNVEDSFAVTDESLVRGKRVLLVDDIITTGATVSECAKALKDAGARKVFALSLARNVLQ